MIKERKTVTIILPCLNESKTLFKCVKKIESVLAKSQYNNKYSILVCDNGSTDGSVNLCKKHKIPYIINQEKGYGNILRAGIAATKTENIVMLDCDLSYNPNDIPKFIKALEEGNDLVVGNRYKGGIKKNAMPLSHKIGARALSIIANFFFRTKIHDFHCGLRAFNRKKIESLKLESTGFEFASEMIILAKIKNLKTYELPTSLSKDGRNHKSHLRTFRDGFRHLSEIIKLKFRFSKPFRYISTFFITILAILSLTFFSCLIPHDLVEKNIVTSIDQLEDQFRPKIDIKKIIDQIPSDYRYNRYEKYGDIRNYAMAFATDSSKPLESAIKMSYNPLCDHLTDCTKSLYQHPNQKDYPRYWQGQSVFVHFTSILFSVNTLYIILAIIFTILFIYVLYRLFCEDKFLSFVFLLGSLSINIFFTMSSIQFALVMFIMLFTVLIAIKAHKHQIKYFDIYFLIFGMLTCYFDFLTSETITLSMPLFIYSYLEIKANKKVELRKIINYSILWLIGYGGAFLVKWLLCLIVYGLDDFNQLMRYLIFHTAGKELTFHRLYALRLNFSAILPLGFIDFSGWSNIIIAAIFFICNLIKNRKWMILYFICLIPIARLILLANHSALLPQSTYRALLCLCILTIATILKVLKRLVIRPMVSTK